MAKSTTTEPTTSKPEVRISDLTDSQRAQLAKIFSVDPEFVGETLVLTVRKGNTSTPKLCACGCGVMTKGGRWVSGDDSKHRSALLLVADGKRTPEPGRYDNYTAEQAMAELKAEAGWLKNTKWDTEKVVEQAS
jgi:hypothetical protein